MTPTEALQTAVQHHQAGRLEQAEAIYRTLPNHPDALHLSGVIAYQTGNCELAVTRIGKAIRLNPTSAAYHGNLGLAYFGQHRFDDAIASYRRALSLEPKFIEAHNNLGNACKELGKLDDAITHYQAALALNPNYVEAWNNLGVVLKAQGKLEDAVRAYQQALTVRADFVGARYNLATALKELGLADAAAVSYHHALTLQPELVDAHFKLGVILYERGDLADAVVCFQNVLVLNPDNADACNNLGNALREQRYFDDAIMHYRRALELKPDFAEAYSNLGGAYKEQGRFAEAMTCFRKALALKPDCAEAYSSMLLAMVYADNVAPEQLKHVAQAFDAQIADRLRRTRPFRNDPQPERRLRIGYVSADFLNHAVSYSIEPLLARHDHQQFEVFAYANHIQEDAVTQRIKSCVDHWRVIHHLSDDAAADLIEVDGIDILIDLSGHTAGNRLLVFARKPAPVQVAYLGYPATTGMRAMDYRISDVHAEPPGMTEAWHVERLQHLPQMFCCYRPRDNSPEPIDHPPADDNGYVTFGCFNNFSKITDRVIAAWATLLARVPSARLMLEIHGLEDVSFRKIVENRFSQQHIAPERLILVPRKKENQYVLYNRIDIALDPFPCNGGTTSLDTLWMGVPLITLAGAMFHSRLGVTILMNAGLPELIADSEDTYVEVATLLATDLARLRTVRTGLRERVRCGPIMDAQRFAGHMEEAYRAMWRQWCAQR